VRQPQQGPGSGGEAQKAGKKKMKRGKAGEGREKAPGLTEGRLAAYGLL
jgi:hypothetical protein